jgi:hypothetical protein
MTCQMTVQTCWCGWWRGGSTRFSCRYSGEEDAWGALGASARVGACGHAGRRFFNGFSPVDSSRLPLHDGILKNMFWELWVLSLDQTLFFSRTSSDTSCSDIQAIKHTQIYMVRQLTYSTELLVCINHSKKQYKQRGGENSSQLNSTHSSSL